MPENGGPLEAFIERWQGREGGQERANYALFLSELCDVLSVARPEPAGATTENNAYVFERRVDRRNPDGTVTHGRIDLYKKGCFVLEAKQSRLKGASKELPAQAVLLPAAAASLREQSAEAHRWDVLMLNARQQAEGYAHDIPGEWPPFILVCDVGNVIEVYADFSGQGKNYSHFPDRQSFRVRLDDLRSAEIRHRLGTIWMDPASLDPAKTAAKVTGTIARRLAAVSKALEKENYAAEDVAMFLMRCVFTMFAQSVELLPKDSFVKLLERCEAKPQIFQHEVGQLWEAMDQGRYAHGLEADVRHFNGEFFKSRGTFPLARKEIGELRAAAKYDWREVDPSIFGTLIEQALDPEERRRLGAHYTPRSYVERLVVATIIEPLRADWKRAEAAAEMQHAEGRHGDAIATVKAFHERLCGTRVLDPACGSGNFLYVALELMKRLEGEVLEGLARLGGQEALRGLQGHTVDPHQFLGLEINPRAARIAELVLWIGHLQWHIRTKGGLPSEPILQAFRNIKTGDAVLTWDDYPRPHIVEGKETYPRARRPEWPDVDFIVGNPPFTGGKDIRASRGDGYAEALWEVNGHRNDSADYVMYWWDRAAELLTRSGTKLRRFGLVTTNSISQVFQRRVIERHLYGKAPVSIVMAIPDHPWTKATHDAAAVRIAMTVVDAGSAEGVLREVFLEQGLASDTPQIEFAERRGRINADLTVGIDITSAVSLLANEALCSRGMALHGAGFIVTRSEAEHLGLSRRPGLDTYIREYRHGRDLTSRPRGVMVIDLDGLDIDEVRTRFPEVYQHLLLTVKPERDKNNEEYRRVHWWLFGRRNTIARGFLEGLPRYIATAETSKHRVFQFLEKSIVPDNMIVAIGLDDAYALGVLSSRIHITWTQWSGGTLEDRPRYTKSRCFDPFPFPAANNIQKQTIRLIAEELDAHRKRVLAEYPKLTLTGLYNVLEKLRAGMAPEALSESDRRIFDDGLVLLMKELHDRLDAAVADAYGWPANLSDEDILARLVALNRQRTAEEARGEVRWLRPDYQAPRFGTPRDRRELDLEGGGVRPAVAAKMSFPKDETAQIAAVMAVLAAEPAALDVRGVAANFRQGQRIARKALTVLAALTRMGHVGASGDTFTLLRRAA